MGVAHKHKIYLQSLGAVYKPHFTFSFKHDLQAATQSLLMLLLDMTSKSRANNTIATCIDNNVSLLEDLFLVGQYITSLYCFNKIIKIVFLIVIKKVYIYLDNRIIFMFIF